MGGLRPSRAMRAPLKSRAMRAPLTFRAARALLPALALLLALCAAPAQAAEFTVQDIRIEGLERAAAGRVLAALPIKVGDRFDEADTPDLIRRVYRTGLFDDVALRRLGGVLVIRVEERPGIAAIAIDGNNLIEEEQLFAAFRDIGVAVGEVFDRSSAARLEEELRQEYYAIGRYEARVEVAADALPGNQVALRVNIAEGEVASIETLRFSGNQAIDTDALREVVQSGRKPWYAFWSSADEYSKYRLAADIEAVRHLYQDRGYLDFEVERAAVSLSPDKRRIYIDIAVREGERYRVKAVRVGGSPEIDRAALLQQAKVAKGQVFSRGAALADARAMELLLSDTGYAFAKVTPAPRPDPDSLLVELAFIVDAGSKTRVRRINFRGNHDTNDEVFRRELRQLEGAEYSSGKIELSRRRLQRLPYVASVDIANREVAGAAGLVDLDIDVTERLSGNFNIGAGISNSEGAVLSFQLNQNNFLGTGNGVQLAFSNSDSRTNYALSFYNPFYTINGVGRSLGFNYRKTDYEQEDRSDANSRELRLSLSYSVPTSENDRFSFGWTMQTISISADMDSERLTDFINREGDNFFNPVILHAGLDYDTRDRSLFPTEGAQIGGNIRVFPPGNELNYYKADYSQLHYWPLDDDANFVFAARGRVSYANSFGGTSEVPFYDRFYAGGSRTLRGYRNSSLGPRDSDGDTIGGDFRVLGNFDLFLPTGFLYDVSRLRAGVFTDIGNVHEDFDEFDIGELRGSYGLQFQWLTAIGGLSFNFAGNFNDKPGDRTETFQFDLGTAF